jgi:chromosome segregation ATPase
MANLKLLFALIAGLAVAPNVGAKMYKWVDDKGTTHYGETIPPEYANKDRQELNKSGRVIKHDDVLTPEERRAKEAAEVKKHGEDEAAVEQKRRDKALVNTYSNVDEIDLARKRNLQQIEARVSSTTSQIKLASESLQALKSEAEARIKAGKPVAASLQEDINESETRLKKLQQDLEKFKTEKATVEARYDMDKARYKELTGK